MSNDKPPPQMTSPKCIHPCSHPMQGPEIRTGALKDGKSVQLTTGKEITVTTDYAYLGDENMIAMRCDNEFV